MTMKTKTKSQARKTPAAKKPAVKKPSAPKKPVAKKPVAKTPAAKKPTRKHLAHPQGWTREEWMNRLAKLMFPKFEELGYSVPAIRMSIGWTSKGPRGKAIGECWTDAASSDRVYEIFISPQLSDNMKVAGVLAHEICHAIVGIKAQHGPVFKKIATEIGLEGKMTATTEGKDFKAWVKPMLAELGPLPHGALDASKIEKTGRKKQKAYLIKCECPECGYLVRVTTKWLDVAAPMCPVDEVVMVAEAPEEPEED